MALARRCFDDSSWDLESKARALERLARSAATSVVYAPAPGDDDPGWAEVASQLRVEGPGGASRSRLRAGV